MKKGSKESGKKGRHTGDRSKATRRDSQGNKGKKGAKKSSRKKVREIEEDKGRRLGIWIVLLIVLIVILAALGLYIFLFNPLDGDGNGIDKSIKFPRDEGAHDETHEFWRVAFILTAGGGERFGVAATYTKYSEAFGGEDERQIVITDESDVTGKTYYSKRYLADLSTVNGRLNITYEGEGGLEKDYWNQLEGFNYSYYAEYYEGGSMVAVIDLDINYLKPPILLGEEGKIFNVTANFGTIYGYSQTRQLAQGTLTIGGTSFSVQGHAWIDHQWGSWSYTEEYWQLQLENGLDMAVLRLYSTDTLLYEHFYKVDANGNRVVVTDFDLDYLKYKIVPDDPLQKRCVSVKWRLTSTDFNISAQPGIINQFTFGYTWEGTISASGLMGGSSVQARGYTTIKTLRDTTLNINEVSHLYEPVGTWVTANVTDDLPIVNVTLKYNSSADPTIRIVSMNYVGNNEWEGQITIQVSSTTIFYFVETYDLADTYKESDWFSYVVV